MCPKMLEMISQNPNFSQALLMYPLDLKHKTEVNCTLGNLNVHRMQKMDSLNSLYRGGFRWPLCTLSYYTAVSVAQQKGTS